MQAAAAKAVSKLQPIQEALKSVAATAATELLALPCAPPLTWNVLRALLLVFGKPSQDVASWLKCRCCSSACMHSADGTCQHDGPYLGVQHACVSGLLHVL